MWLIDRPEQIVCILRIHDKNILSNLSLSVCAKHVHYVTCTWPPQHLIQCIALVVLMAQMPESLFLERDRYDHSWTALMVNLLNDQKAVIQTRLWEKCRVRKQLFL